MAGTNHQKLEEELRKERLSSQAALAVERQRYEEARTTNKSLEDNLRKKGALSEAAVAEWKQKYENNLRQFLNLQTELLSTRREVSTASQQQVPHHSATVAAYATSQNHSIGSAMQINSMENATKLIEELQASHAAEVEELGRLRIFFQANSERLARETRVLKSTNKALLESVETKDRELEDQLSHIYVMEAQMEEVQEQRLMPGAGSNSAFSENRWIESVFVS